MDNETPDGNPRAIELISVFLSRDEDAITQEFERLWREPAESAQPAVIALASIGAQLSERLSRHLGTEPLDILGRLDEETDDDG